MRRVFVLVPSLRRTGPVIGAAAVANALSSVRDVTLVALKGGTGVAPLVDRRVRVVSLSAHRGWAARLKAYRALLTESGGRSQTASLSSCFSADMVNVMCGSLAFTCASVRGNLPMNYRFDYGAVGMPLAALHLTCLRACDAVVVMTHAMAAQVRRYTNTAPEVIGNFVDESHLDRYRAERPSDGPFRFVFLGSLTARKQPLVLVDAISELTRLGVSAHLDFVGDGPLRSTVEERVRELRLDHVVSVHGNRDEPYDILARADAMVLPSLSEGLSRASLEALYLGVPCVLRAVDGNGELIRDGVNGTLFRENASLAAAMATIAAWSRARTGSRDSLLPEAYRQQSAVRKYLALLDSAQ
jgi:glycosyltransferase involved in cell wall biosynthesis